MACSCEIYLALGAVVLVTYMWSRRKSTVLKDFLGPSTWPLVGNAFQMDPKAFYKTLDQWYKTYGGLYKISIFGKPVLVVTDPNAVNEVLVKKGKDFAGRSPITERMKVLGSYDNLASMGPGKALLELRKASHQMLKLYDSGLARLDAMTFDVINDGIEDINKKNGIDFDLKPLVYKMSLNIVFQLLAGKKYNEEEEPYKLAVMNEEELKKFSNMSLQAMLLDFFPLTKYFGARREYENLLRWRKVYWEFLDKMEEEAKMSDDYELTIVHFVNNLAESSENVTRRECRQVSGSLFMGGFGNTTNTVYALVNILLHYPDAYKKIQSELDEVLGERQVTLKDRESLPYMMASLNEAFRYTTLTPILLPHKSVVDTELGGRQVPADTEIFVNAWSHLHNPDIFPDPWEFKPERFLAEDGNLLPVDHPIRKNMLAFGAGPRGCVGEIFARTRIFLVVCALLQRFQFEKGSVVTTCDPRDFDSGGIIRQPPFSVKAMPRF